MRIAAFSDLHLEFADWQPPPCAADLVVLAGDIHVGTDGLPWARRHFPHAAIVYVPGNHEYYDGVLELRLEALRERAREFDIHLLDGDEATLAGVRCLGATLWSDFRFDGAHPDTVARAMDLAERWMPDYRIVRRRDGRLLTPEQTARIHRGQVRWLAGRLAAPFEGPTVVVTHHLPHRRSVHPIYHDSPINPAFVSDLSALVRTPVQLWIHGHTHESMDYEVEGTRVLCNPRGYLPKEPNLHFDPGLCVELPAGAGPTAAIAPGPARQGSRAPGAAE